MTESGLIADTLVVLPTYNEQENIERLVHVICKYSSRLHILIVDDNSPDGTGEVADELARSENRVQVFHRARRLGSASAYKLGFEHALRYNYLQVVTMNADFSHNPRYLAQLIALAQDNDLVIGSRYLAGGGTLGGNTLEQALNHGLNKLVGKLLMIPTTDGTSRLRCYRSAMLQEIKYETTKTEGAAFSLELLNRCARLGYRFAEMPIQYDNRRLSRLAHHHQKIMHSVVTMLRLWLKRLSHNRQPSAASGPAAGNN